MRPFPLARLGAVLPDSASARAGLAALALIAGGPFAAQAQDAGGHVKPIGQEPDEPLDPHALETLLKELRAEQDPEFKLQTDSQARKGVDSRPVEPLAGVGAPAPGWRWNGEVSVQQLSRATLDGAGGRLETRRLGFGFSGVNRLGPGDLWRADYAFESSSYNFQSAGQVVPNSFDPVEDLFRNQIGISRIYAPRGQWGYFARLGINQGMEKEAQIGDSLAYSLIGAVSIPAGPDLSWNVGALVQTELEGQLLVVPILGVDWRINATTRLSTIGPGLELQHDLSDEARVFTRALFQARDYRLDDIGPLPGGIFEDREILVSVGLDWNPGLNTGLVKSSNARIFVGFTPWRELNFLDAQDQEVATVNAEANLVFGLSAQFTL